LREQPSQRGIERCKVQIADVLDYLEGE